MTRNTRKRKSSSSIDETNNNNTKSIVSDSEDDMDSASNGLLKVKLQAWLEEFDMEGK